MKKIIIALLILVHTGMFFIGCIATRPSGKIDNYIAYYIDDTVLSVKGSVKVRFFGVSTLLIDDDETQLLIDGFFSRPSLLRVLTSKVSTNEKLIDSIVSKYKMDRLAGVFVTHSHFDHAFDIAYLSRKTNSTVYGSLPTLNIGRGGGLKEEQMVLNQTGKEYNCGRFSIMIIPYRHSPPSLFNNNIDKIIDLPLSQPAKSSKYFEGGSFDFLIKNSDNSIYIKSSTNYIDGALDSLKADVLLLGVCTLGHQSESFKEEFYKQTVGVLKPKLVIPLHWDNFFMPISKNFQMMPEIMDDIPKGFDFLVNKTKADSLEFKILQSEKSIVLFANK